MYCSPSHHKYMVNGTCFSKKELDIIARDINEKEKKKVISGRSIDKKIQITEYFKDICGDKEYCWLQKLNIETRKKLEAAFRPVKPRSWISNPKAWLSTDDIQYVMSQYEVLHKDFKFLGVHPLDFASEKNGYCIGYELCSFNIDQLGKRKRFAFVINLDYHNQSGSHWVAIYCSLYQRKDNFGIYYYDSTGTSPTKEVVEFMNRIKEQVHKSYKPKVASKFESRVNIIQKQYKNTECGMFCIVYLTQCVKNIPFDDICERMRHDDEINKIRDVLYRPM